MNSLFIKRRKFYYKRNKNKVSTKYFLDYDKIVK